MFFLEDFDQNSNGAISWTEFQLALEDERMLAFLASMGLSTGSSMIFGQKAVKNKQKRSKTHAKTPEFPVDPMRRCHRFGHFGCRGPVRSA